MGVLDGNFFISDQTTLRLGTAQLRTALEGGETPNLHFYDTANLKIISPQIKLKLGEPHRKFTNVGRDPHLFMPSRDNILHPKELPAGSLLCFAPARLSVLDTFLACRKHEFAYKTGLNIA